MWAMIAVSIAMAAWAAALAWMQARTESRRMLEGGVVHNAIMGKGGDEGTFGTGEGEKA